MSLQFVHSHDSPKSHDEAIWALQWTNANTVISAGSDGKLIVWDPANGSPIRSLPPHPLALISLSTDTEGKVALTNSIEGTTTLWDLDTGDSIGTHESFERRKGGAEPAWSVSLHPNGGTYAMTNASGNVHILSAEAGSFGDSLKTLTTGRSKFGLFVTHSPDGQRIAMSNEAGQIYIFDVESGSLATTFSSHAMGVRSMSWSPDSQLLLSASDDKRLVLHDVRSTSSTKPGSGAVASLNGHSSWVLSASIAADGRAAVSGSADRTIKIWDLTARTCVSTLQESEEVWGVAWKPGGGFGTGSFAATGQEGTIRFFRSAGTG